MSWRSRSIAATIRLPASDFVRARGATGLTGLELKVEAAPAATVAAVVRPKEVQVWNVNVAERAYDRDFADPAEPLRPVRIVAAPTAVSPGPWPWALRNRSRA